MARREDDNPLMYGTRSGPHWGRVLGITLCVILAVVAAGSAAIYYFGHNLISMANYVADEDVQQLETLPEEAVEESTEAEGAAKGAVLNESELDALHSKMSQLGQIDAVMDEAVYNIVLAGVDRVDKSWNGNADSVMLVSINNDKKRISVISLMRDTYVDIPGHGYDKLNASYAYGGGPLLCDTIEENYRIDVERYGAVDFEDMVYLIDALGGIEMTWTASEVEVANGYMIDMCQRVLNIPYEEHLLMGPGTYTSDGVQAVAYARNRFVGNSDYSRTQRQRYVISQMVEKIKTLSTSQLMAFVTKALPLVTHNVPENEIWALVGDAPAILKYDFVMDRVPYDNKYETIDVDGQGMLVPDWQTTITQMHQTVYGDGSVSGNADNNGETEADTEFTAEYMELTGGTGTLFPNGYKGDGSNGGDGGDAGIVQEEERLG